MSRPRRESSRGPTHFELILFFRWTYRKKHIYRQKFLRKCVSKSTHFSNSL